MKNLLFILLLSAFCVAEAQETQVLGKTQTEIFIDSRGQETVKMWTIFEIHNLDSFSYSIKVDGKVFSEGEVSISKGKNFSKDSNLIEHDILRVQRVTVEETGECFIRFMAKQSRVPQKAVMIITSSDT